MVWSPPLYTAGDEVDRGWGAQEEEEVSTLLSGVPELKNLGLHASTTTRSKYDSQFSVNKLDLKWAIF